jgi:hypothetical protein
MAAKHAKDAKWKKKMKHRLSDMNHRPVVNGRRPNEEFQFKNF